MIEFNVEQDPAFYESLTYLPKEVAEAVIGKLFHVAALLEWDDFVEQYAWRPYILTPIDTYPGANDRYQFTVPLPKGMRPPNDLVDVYCELYPGVVVVCAVAK
ncbi:MAG: hypothetical protein L0H10_03525 [Comamonas sp.]|uniref:hypothetical protein n=1 Tax=Comamonas sp. TaxID=34028 RepID=UPI002648B1D8|nr:hypothetical protein [Comamonas sp.]MDN5502882.1 hypothetical protein [Comamonas sp.]MDN5537937.1 hypothetical protein [Comamonas sp.]